MMKGGATEKNSLRKGYTPNIVRHAIPAALTVAGMGGLLVDPSHRAGAILMSSGIALHLLQRIAHKSRRVLDRAIPGTSFFF